jgi:hypothetical protein
MNRKAEMPGMTICVVWYTGANLPSPSLGYISAIKVMDYEMDGRSSIPSRRAGYSSFPTHHTAEGISLHGTLYRGKGSWILKICSFSPEMKNASHHPIGLCLLVFFMQSLGTGAVAL